MVNYGYDSLKSKKSSSLFQKIWKTMFCNRKWLFLTFIIVKTSDTYYKMIALTIDYRGKKR